MSDKTGIEWTDATWNPVTGCAKVSAGCKHCYAEREWPRMTKLVPAYAGREFTDVATHADRLDQPLRWKKPRMIFVNSMSDLFHEAVTFEFIDSVFAVMELAPQHVFQVLPFCPEDVRVAAWVKPFAAFKANVTRAWTWEPVIFRFARPRTREQDTWRDFVAEPIAMRRGFPGAKPDKFCFWVFEGLNLHPEDEFHDIFPGSGAVGDAWQKWIAARQRPEQFALESV